MILRPKLLFKNSDFFKALKLRHDLGNQTAILITGNTNSGKTVLATLLYYINEIGLFNREIDIKDEQMYFSILSFAKNISQLYDKQILYDEAGTELDIADWNGIFPKMMKYILQTQRTHTNTYYILLPHVRYITQTLLPLFNFHIVVNLDVHVNQVTGKITKRRYADIYKITPLQTYSGYRDYQDIRLIMTMNIPDVKQIKNTDFIELMKKFSEIEKDKKDKIAHSIEDMVRTYEAKEEIEKLKTERSIKSEKLKIKKIEHNENKLKEKIEKDKSKKPIKKTSKSKK